MADLMVLALRLSLPTSSPWASGGNRLFPFDGIELGYHHLPIMVNVQTVRQLTIIELYYTSSWLGFLTE